MTTITPTLSINPTQLKDDVKDQLQKLGLTESQLSSYLRQIEYRKSYNKRPDVVAKRKLYNMKRNLVMKQLREVIG